MAGTVTSSPDFAWFDRRHYRTMSVRDGYREWTPTYDTTVDDEMDLALLDRVATIDWSTVHDVVDLGCGTGRTGAWLRGRGVARVDGVDATPEMLAVARGRSHHDHLLVADVRSTGLTEHRYDIVMCSLVDEHLADLDPLYHEARRLARDDGAFVIVGFHPFFIMAMGMPTHFDGADDEPIAIETHVHLPSEHVRAATRAGMRLAELHEGVVDEAWLERKPGWSASLGWPISFVWVWSMSTPTERSS